MKNNKSGKTFFSIEKLRDSKILRWLIIIVLSLILILILAGNIFDKKEKSSELTVNQYVEDLENRLEKTLSKVKGAGDVSVVITIESGMETVLASKTTVTENSSGKETTETPIIVNGKTVVLKEMYPKITGVLIVSEGAKDIQVMKRLQQATISLLNINLDQIEILSMK